MDSLEHPALGLPRDLAPQRDTLSRVADLTLKKRSLAFEISFGTAAFVLALYVRFLSDRLLPPGFPFLTFFPAVLLTSGFASVRAGAVVAVAGGLAAWFFFIAPTWSFSLNGASATAMIFYAVIVVTQLLLISAMNQALTRLRALEKRSRALAMSRALMFSELQHRVSNNLATVAALLRMQAAQTKDPQAKQALSEAQQRVNTISHLQRRLHSPNIQSVAVDEFIRDMAADTLRAAGAENNVTLHFALQKVQVAHELAVPLGLIVSELLMNAVEHSANPGDHPVKIGITLSSSREDSGMQQVILDVRDSGAGVDPAFDLGTTKSLGLSIARQFATQLSGELSLFNAPEGGAISRLTFINPPLGS